ncbi:MAG: LOG family protein [Fimbriimonadaceae bacterium]|nr:LOG family protein [Fimbriimonadaceae bacterium]
MNNTVRRRLVAVVGNSHLGQDDPKIALAQEVGRLLVDSGYRVVTGGLGGVMAGAMEGARTSSKYAEGDTIGILPGYDPNEASPSADIVLATGMNLARNLIVANSDGLIVIGGGAGTLSEIALAWQMRRPIVALSADGWGNRLCESRIDDRIRQTDLADDQVYAAVSPAAAVQLITELMPRYAKRMRYV